VLSGNQKVTAMKMKDIFLVMNRLSDGSITFDHADAKKVLAAWAKGAMKFGRCATKAEAHAEFISFVNDYKGSKFRFFDKVKLKDGQVGTIVNGKESQFWANKKEREFFVVTNGGFLNLLFKEKDLKKV
jgi:hypothetical protein